MLLSPELVKLVERTVEDEGYQPGVTVFSEQDYDDHLAEFLQHVPESGVYIFAYGSLIWNPCFEYIETLPARVRGLHRSFCVKLLRFRGTHAQPGRMMSLDEGGECEGLVYRLAAGSELKELAKVWRREMTRKPPVNMPAWIEVETAKGTLRAIAFRADRTSNVYVLESSSEDTAEILAKAVGHWGSGAEYLLRTVMALEQAGIHDPYLWRLQELVAGKIASRHGFALK